MDIWDKRGVENVVADHLSHLEKENKVEELRKIEEYFPNEQLMMVDTSFALVCGYRQFSYLQGITPRDKLLIEEEIPP